MLSWIEKQRVFHKTAGCLSGVIAVTCISAAAALAAPASDQAQDAAFKTVVEPFLRRNCVGCHNSSLKSAGIDFSAFTSVSTATAERTTWERALRMIRSGEMPPSPVPRPPGKTLQPVIAWLEQQVARYDASHGLDPGTVTARRLNRAEYN
ncbi:MAG: c-type cytochrome domain-containing protein, partial [Bryobacteraceae bacterium]